MRKGKHLFTSEAVTEGHPDKICDQISDAVLDEILLRDKMARVACETMAGMGFILVTGEITTKAYVNIAKIARDVIKDVGYDKPEYGFDFNTVGVLTSINEQSPDIAMGVNEDEAHEIGAGDQGMMSGYACKDTPSLMPAPHYYAQHLAMRLAEVRKKRILPYLRPDGKTQVTISYDEEGKPAKIVAVVIAAQHDPDIDIEELRADIKEYVINPVCGELLADDCNYFINNTGRFVIGGPVADTGCTGRKIICDTYGGIGNHGGGAFCLAGDSLINTEKGMVQIDKCQEIGEKGLLVKTDIHPMPAGGWYDNGIKPTELIITEDGYHLEATLNHNIRVLDDEGNYVWKSVEELNINDWIPIQTKNRLFGDDKISEFKYCYKSATTNGRKKKYSFPKKLTEDYAYLLGLAVGSGECTDKDCIKIRVCEKEMKQIVQALFERVANNKTKTYGHWAYLGGVELRAYLEHLGLAYVKSYEKVVPHAIFNASKHNCAAFLRGLFDSNGCIHTNSRNKSIKYIHLTTTSKKLVEQVQLLLLSFGIVSRICTARSNSKKAGYIKRKRIEPSHVCYDLTIKESQSIRLFSENIGFTLRRKQEILDTSFLDKQDTRILPNQRQRIIRLFKKLSLEEQQKDVCKIARFIKTSKGKTTKELTYEKLGEFIKTYEHLLKNNTDFIQLQQLYYMGHYYSRLKTKIPSFAHTYDLNIPFSHTFTANGIICHNSGKDPTKVDKSGTYMVRHVAKNIVAADLADQCEVQISYAIGSREPISLFIDTHGTAKVDTNKLYDAVKKVFDFRPGKIIEYLDLRRPIFRKTTNYGHFGREDRDFTWEKTNKVEELRKACGL